MIPEQETAFWDAIEAFDEEGLLPYVILIGSWAEYVYSFYFTTNFKPSLRTTDADFLYTNLRMPKSTISISEALKEKGFTYTENLLTGVGKFVKEGFLEIEFLVRVLGSGERRYEKIPSIGITAVGLREVNLLANYPLQLECRKYKITVPEPEAYIIQKLIINPLRTSDEKREKDMRGVDILLRHINRDRLRQIYDNLPKKDRQVVDDVCDSNAIKI